MSNARNIATVTDVKPMFSAYQSVAQSLAANTWTKIQFQTKEFDLTNDFDNVTNFRFQPTKAGYYQVNASLDVGSGSSGGCQVYKNGAQWKAGDYVYSNFARGIVSAIVYLNGSTDYIELYGVNGASQNTTAIATSTYFQATYIANGV